MRVQRPAGRGRGRLRGGHRDTKQRVRTEPALGRRAVERDHLLVERPLIEVGAHERRRDLAVDVRDGRADALAEIPRLVAVAQFQRFAFAGRRAGRHRRASERAAGADVDFNGGIAA